eukprot:233672-Pyramimonas_sp.AAC.1
MEIAHAARDKSRPGWRWQEQSMKQFPHISPLAGALGPSGPMSSVWPGQPARGVSESPSSIRADLLAGGLSGQSSKSSRNDKGGGQLGP